VPPARPSQTHWSATSPTTPTACCYSRRLTAAAAARRGRRGRWLVAARRCRVICSWMQMVGCWGGGEGAVGVLRVLAVFKA